MPQVELIDMRAGVSGDAQAGHLLAPPAGRHSAQRLENGEQTMRAAQPPRLLQLRRLPRLRRARAVRQLLRHPDLSPARPPPAVPLLQLRRTRCPRVCPKCESEHIYFLGIGSERVEEELHQRFPTARIARLDRDTVTGKRQYETILHGFREGDYDILVGTQMIAKGHDIPNVTLVGVVSADIGLGHAGFPRGRAHLPAADAGGRARRPRQSARHRPDPDHQPRPLRHPLRRRSRITPASTRRNCTSAA